MEFWQQFAQISEQRRNDRRVYIAAKKHKLRFKTNQASFENYYKWRLKYGARKKRILKWEIGEALQLQVLILYSTTVPRPPRYQPSDRYENLVKKNSTNLKIIALVRSARCSAAKDDNSAFTV